MELSAGASLYRRNSSKGETAREKNRNAGKEKNENPQPTAYRESEAKAARERQPAGKSGP